MARLYGEQWFCAKYSSLGHRQETNQGRPRIEYRERLENTWF